MIDRMTDLTTGDDGQSRPQFTTSRIRRGYSCPEVDEFLDRVATALRNGEPAPDIEDVRFSVCFRGYDQQEVDIFLDDLLLELHRH
jgi:DivIVA domain-containing protein